MTETHEELLTRWRARYPTRQFVRDGIIDKSEWNTASPRVLFILKENYDPTNSGVDWDLTKSLRDNRGPYGRTFWSCSYLAFLLAQPHERQVPSMPSSEEEFSECRRSLLGSAIINVKKPVGSSSSDPDDIAHYARKDGDLIAQQISLIDPQIVVCGGTYDALAPTVLVNGKSISQRVWRVEGRLVIDFWHPGLPAPGELLYYGFAWLCLQAGILRANPDR
jgi:hypothetical protein